MWIDKTAQAEVLVRPKQEKRKKLRRFADPAAPFNLSNTRVCGVVTRFVTDHAIQIALLGLEIDVAFMFLVGMTSIVFVFGVGCKLHENQEPCPLPTKSD